MSLSARVLSICLFAAFPWCVLASPSVADLAAATNVLTLGPSAPVSNLQLTYGHAIFSLGQGTGAPVMAGGQQVGVFYSGPGAFSYTTSERVEFPATRYNAKSSKVKLEESAEKIVIRDSWRTLLVWSIPAASPGSGSAVANNDAAFREHRETFSENRDAPSTTHRYAMHAIDDPSGQWIRAEILGGSLYTYELDPSWSQTESLVALRTVETADRRFKHALFPVVLSEQPIGRTFAVARSARLTLTHLDIDLLASDGTEAKLIVTETVVPHRKAQRVFRFDLYDRQYVEAGREPRVFNVKSVTDGQGRTLAFDHDLGDLIVSLPEPAQAEAPLKLRFEIEGNFLYRPGGDNYWELGIEPWFPQPELNEQAFSLHALVRVKRPFVPFAPGKTVRRVVEGDYNVLETQLDEPVHFIAILAGKYQFAEETRDGITVRVASYANKNDMAFKRLTGLAFDIINYYPMFLGPFPFSEMNIIEKNDFGYGQAPATMMFITKEAFTPLNAEANAYVGGINARFAHEIAHQYWGHVVKMPSFEEQWLTEAFAEYSAAILMRAAKGESVYQRMLNNWRLEAKEWVSSAPIPLANRLRNFTDPYDQWMARKHLIYDKGALLLASLHSQLGDQVFLTFMKSYQRSFRWKFGTTHDVAGLLQFMAKKDFTPFFNEYYWGTGMPEVKR